MTNDELKSLTDKPLRGHGRLFDDFEVGRNLLNYWEPPVLINRRGDWRQQ